MNESAPGNALEQIRAPALRASWRQLLCEHSLCAGSRGAMKAERSSDENVMTTHFASAQRRPRAHNGVQRTAPGAAADAERVVHRESLAL